MTDFSIASIRERIATVEEQISNAACRAQRDPNDVKLVIVTKTHGIEKIKAVFDAGAFRFGENYAEEAMPKIASLGLPGIEWHMIGHIQSRKAGLVSQSFTYVHSLDSLRLANRLNRIAAEMNRILPVCLECNASGEQSKYGWDITLEQDWQILLPEFQQIVALPNLRVEGLMTMAPYTTRPETVRPFFARVRRFRDYLRVNIPLAQWNELSMGMSGDFEVAVEEGATWVRIGHAIMGPRE
jgi:PLP dependent protein